MIDKMEVSNIDTAMRFVKSHVKDNYIVSIAKVGEQYIVVAERGDKDGTDISKS